MERQRILVVEDDPAIRKGIVHSLRFNGYETVEAGDAASGLVRAMEEAFDLMLLDLNLPDGDGLGILEAVRGRSSGLPVIVLTARGEEADRVRGLKGGADDYVVKPFGALELLARIEAVLRRTPARPERPQRFRFRGGELDLVKREAVFEDGSRTPLSEREADLLAYLAGHAGRAVTRGEILAQVWRLNPEAVETRTVDMHIARLREKLKDDSSDPKVILTMRGRGYQLAEPGA